MPNKPVGVIDMPAHAAGHASAYAPGAPDRRDPQSRGRLLQRVRSEFEDMPGLILTLAQGARLFTIRVDICARVFGELEGEGLLHKAPRAQYTRRSLSH